MDNQETLADCFAVLQLYAERRIKKRNQLMLSSLFRYKQMFQKFYKATQLSQKIDYVLLYFRRFQKNIHEKRMKIVKFIINREKIGLQKQFQSWKTYFLKKKNQRELLQTIQEYKEAQIIEKAFNELRKNIIFSQGLKRLIKNQIYRRQAVGFASLKEYLKIKKFKRDTLRSVQDYFQQNTILKCFKYWNYGCIKADEDIHKYIRLRNCFLNWRNELDRSNDINMKKITLFRVHSLLKWNFIRLKKIVEFEKLNTMAKKFHLFQIFHAFCIVVRKNKFKQYKKRKALHFFKNQHSFFLKKKIFQLFKKAVSISQEERFKDEAVNSYYESKEKERLALQTFQKLKLNVKINKAERHRKKMLQKKSLLRWREFRQVSIERKRLIVLKIFNRKKELIEKSFFFLKKFVEYRRAKLKMAVQYYQKRMKRTSLYNWLGNIVNDYLLKQVDADNYYKFKMKLRIFQQLEKNKNVQHRKKLIDTRIIKFQNKQEDVLLWRSFQKFKGVIVSILRHKKCNYDLVNSVFYNWKLLIKMKRIY
ncbi:hypothetical protein ABPG74_022131 [Tetrahymena malaccensis]